MTLPSRRAYLLGNLPNLVRGGLQLLPHVARKMFHILDSVLCLACHNMRGVATLDILHCVGSLAGHNVGDLANLSCLF